MYRTVADRFRSPWPWLRRAITNIETDIGQVRRTVLEIPTLLKRLEKTIMAQDRDLITTILAALGPIAEGIAAKDAKIAALEQQLADAGVAAATDEAGDAAALAPVGEAVAAIQAALAASPTTPATEPEPIPVEEVPAAVGEASDPADPGTVPGGTSTP